MGGMTTARAQTLDAPLVPATRATSTVGVARAGLWLLFAAHVVASWGTQWDIQWHLRIGRDSFWIAPHVMTYSGVTLLVLISFGVLAWTTLRGGGEPGLIRVVGVTGPRGYHAAAWGIALTVLAAPIDDLWHRLFGLDVTLWSPPHMLGLLGGTANAAACWLIARESYPAGSRARLVATIIAGALVGGGISLGLQPGIRIAYTYGGLRFFTYPMLAALLMPLALVVVARLSRLRAAPLVTIVAMLAVGFTGAAVARAGFAWLRPVPFIVEEIAKDPTSPIALAHEMARRNGAAPGAWTPRVLLVALLAAGLMVAVDARRRPALAALAYGLTIYVGVGLVLAGMPAFATLLPSATDTVVAAAIVVVAGLAGGALAGRVTAGERV